MTREDFESDLLNEVGFDKVFDGENKKFVKDGKTIFGRPCRHCEVTTTKDGMNISYTASGFSKYNRGLSWRAMAEKKTAIQVFGEMFKYFNL